MKEGDVAERARAAWVYFLQAPRLDFADTMQPHEEAVWDEHFTYLKQLLADGVLILAGPTLGRINTGIAVVEAEDAAAARAIMEADPAVASGIVGAELRPFHVSLLRGRD